MTTNRQRFSCLISYIGTDFCGWQRQNGHQGTLPSIQATLEDALLKITEEKRPFVGSGRTDAGVHALGQVAHFDLERKIWDEQKLLKGLNSAIPRSIRILRMQKVPRIFHAQKSAQKKRYTYFIQQGKVDHPFLHPYSWWVRRPLDLAAMESALNVLEGQHDFLPFRASGATPGSTVREIFDCGISLGRFELLPVDQTLIKVWVEGSGFLKQMVRGIVGTLVEIGEGKRPASDMERILQTQDRSQVGVTAAARGLWLERVDYPEIG